MRSHARSFVALVLTLVSSAPGAARADGQLWTSLENRVPVSSGAWGLPNAARWVSEARVGGPRDGLSVLLLRVGPMWDVHPNVNMNLNGVVAYAANASGDLRPESRVELEPNLRGRVGPLAVNFRQRAEVRWMSTEASFRYRLQGRVTWHPERSKLAPFLATEGFFGTRLRVLELRNLVGLSVFVGDHLRFDLAYMARPRQTVGDWTLTHVGLFSVTFAPKIGTVIDSGGS